RPESPDAVQGRRCIATRRWSAPPGPVRETRNMGTGSNGTKSSAKVFSFVDSSNSSRVKSDRDHHNRGVAPEGATRAATDRPVKDRKHPLEVLRRCTDWLQRLERGENVV